MHRSQSSRLPIQGVSGGVQVIKKVEAAREKARNEQAIQSEPAQTRTPLPDAEKSVREANILAPEATPYDVPPEAPETFG